MELAPTKPARTDEMTGFSSAENWGDKGGTWNPQADKGRTEKLHVRARDKSERPKVLGCARSAATAYSGDSNDKWLRQMAVIARKKKAENGLKVQGSNEGCLVWLERRQLRWLQRRQLGFCLFWCGSGASQIESSNTK